MRNGDVVEDGHRDTLTTGGSQGSAFASSTISIELADGRRFEAIVEGSNRRPSARSPARAIAVTPPTVVRRCVRRCIDSEASSSVYCARLAQGPPETPTASRSRSRQTDSAPVPLGAGC